MRITIPTITGLANTPAYIQQIVSSIEQLAKELYVLTSKGMTLKNNISYEIVQFKNEENTPRWVLRRHGLGREPIGLLWRKGNISAAKEVIFSESDVSVYLDAGASLTLVLM
jgi:hypothetical protein